MGVAVQYVPEPDEPEEIREIRKELTLKLTPIVESDIRARVAQSADLFLLDELLKREGVSPDSAVQAAFQDRSGWHGLQQELYDLKRDLRLRMDRNIGNTQATPPNTDGWWVRVGVGVMLLAILLSAFCGFAICTGLHGSK